MSQGKISEIVEQEAVEQLDLMNEKLLLAICRQKELNRLKRKEEPKWLRYYLLGVLSVTIATIIIKYLF